MSIKQPKEMGEYLKSKENILLLAGELCNTLELDGKKPIDYAAEIARKLDIAVAATGNTVMGLKERGIYKTKKMWLSEMLEYMRRPWREEYMRREDLAEKKLVPLMTERPDLLVLMGYDPRVSDWFISGLKDIETVALTPTPVERATCCLPSTSSLRQWQKLLDELVENL